MNTPKAKLSSARLDRFEIPPHDSAVKSGAGRGQLRQSPVLLLALAASASYTVKRQRRLTFWPIPQSWAWAKAA